MKKFIAFGVILLMAVIAPLVFSGCSGDTHLYGRWEVFYVNGERNRQDSFIEFRRDGTWCRGIYPQNGQFERGDDGRIYLNCPQGEIRLVDAFSREGLHAPHFRERRHITHNGGRITDVMWSYSTQWGAMRVEFTFKKV